MSLAFAVSAQNPILDSLDQEQLVETDDSTRIKLLFKLTREWFYIDVDSARTYIDRAKRLIDNGDFVRQGFVANHYYGLYHRYQGNFREAIPFFENALRGFEQINDRYGMTAPLFNLGVMYDELGNVDRSMQYYLQELGINEELELWSSVANSCNAIGILFKKLDNYNSALAYYDRGIRMLKAQSDHGTKAILQGNKAEVFLALGQLDSALVYALATHQLETLLGRKWGLAYTHQILSKAYNESSQLDLALTHALEAIKLSESLGGNREIATNHIQAGNIYLSLGNRIKATKHLTQGLKISELIELQGAQIDAYQSLAEVAKVSGDYKEALRLQTLFQALKDSLLTIENVRTINELNLKYETAKKEADLRDQKLTILSQARTQQRTMWILGILTLVVILIFLWIWQRRKMLQNELELSHQKLINLSQENKIISMDAMISGQEKERKRIAAELHDGLGGLLSTTRLQIRRIQSDLAALARFNLVEKADRLIAQACDEVRRISHDMMPDTLINLGLIPALKDLIANINAGQQIHADFFSSGIHGKLPDKYELQLFRIVQELVNNVLKHSGANSLIVQLTREGELLTLNVEDDGKGFDANESSDAIGLGLPNVKSRVDFLNGSMNIVSMSGEGTQIEIVIPI